MYQELLANNWFGLLLRGMVVECSIHIHSFRCYVLLLIRGHLSLDIL